MAQPPLHFHVVVLDGLFTETGGEVRFDEATHFSTDDACALTPILQVRVRDRRRIRIRRGEAFGDTLPILVADRC